MYFKAFASVSGCLFATALMAGTALASGHEHREHGPHEHGAGRLNLVMDGNHIEVEYAAAGADIVGFEHPVETSEDRAAIKKATAQLKQARKLFIFPEAAGCKLVSADALYLVDKDMHNDDDDHDHMKPPPGRHDMDHHHDMAPHDRGRPPEPPHGDHHEPPMAHHDHDHDEHGPHHAEFHAHYSFTCAAPSKVKYMDVIAFNQFIATKKIRAQAVGPWGQTAAELVPYDARLDLK